MKLDLKHTIEDMVSDFLYYDRKEDDYLPLGSIEQMINEGETTIEEIISSFEENIRNSLS